MFFRQERVAFLAWRFWLLLWVVITLIWVFRLARYALKRIPEIQAEEAGDGESEEIERKLIYYPQGGQWRLKKALQEADKGQACKDLVLNGRNPSAYQGLVQLAHAIDHFRTAHILAVRKQIPEVMRNRAPGTSGNTAAGRFLSKRQADMAAVLQQLEGAFAEAA